VETLYLNLDWAEWVYERTNGACTPADYSFFSHHSYFAGLGDWVFTSALYGSDSWRVDQFKKHAAKAGHDSQVAVLLHSLAQEFVSHCVDRILSLKPTIVGFTTTFQQNIASLALAQEIKSHAEARGITAGQFAVSWVLNSSFVSGVIAGPRTEEQWDDYLKALDYRFTAEDEALIDRLVTSGHPSTPGFNDPAYPIEGRRARMG